MGSDPGSTPRIPVTHQAASLTGTPIYERTFTPALADAMQLIMANWELVASAERKRMLAPTGRG